MAIEAAFGSWTSPITTDLLVADSISFYDMQASEEALYWTELHPTEKGRLALIRYTEAEGETRLVPDHSIRTRVHEYGGGAFCCTNRSLLFSSDEDRQLYSIDPSGKVTKWTDTPSVRYADGQGHYWVAEKHDGTVDNYLAYVDQGKAKVVASGHDFYSAPRLSPDGKQLAYITWDFPDMQWDSSPLWLATVDAKGDLSEAKKIAGGPDESICQVQWSPKGELHFVSDKTGFWNLYRYIDDNVEPLCPMEAEFGEPAWIFGRSTYAFLSDGKILCRYVVKGVDHLGLLDPNTKNLQRLELPYTVIQNVVPFQNKVYLLAASPSQPLSIVALDLKTGETALIKQSTNVAITEEWISKPEIIEYPAAEGKSGYAFYYPPKNPNYKPLPGEKPPLIVKSHGGPTARSFPYLNLQIQYWTSRGFAFVDVNYGGSSGYGREYLKRLEGNWGVVDVDDCISAAKTLVEQDLADPDRLLIRGGSAGGYTTLAALAFHDFFAGGTSYYGVSDLELLYSDSHKFEIKYTDRLVAPYPEQIDLIRDRSPIHHVDKIRKPVLLLQGEEDKVVPPNQATEIYEALKAKGTLVGMLMFEGEGHGFRQAQNLKRSLDAELYFYSKILEIKLSEQFDPLPVELY